MPGSRGYELNGGRCLRHDPLMDGQTQKAIAIGSACFIACGVGVAYLLDAVAQWTGHNYQVPGSLVELAKFAIVILTGAGTVSASVAGLISVRAAKSRKKKDESESQ